MQVLEKFKQTEKRYKNNSSCQIFQHTRDKKKYSLKKGDKKQ